MVVFQGGAPRKADYRRFRIRGDRNGADGPDDFASMEEVLSRRVSQLLEQSDRSPHDAERDESFAAVPDLIVIDGGKGQLSAGMKVLEPADRARHRGDRTREAARGGLPAGALGAARDPAGLRGPAAAAARARRGAPVRDRPPPQPPRQGDDRARCSTSCAGSGRSASGRCSSTSARPSGWSPPRARSSRRSRGSPASSPATSTASSTGRAEPVAPAPRISVVVATRDRRERLGALLASLRAQTLAPVRVRGDRRRRRLGRRQRGAWLEPSRPGAASTGSSRSPAGRPAARPGPATTAGGGRRRQLVAFTDDDCEAAPDWLERLLERAAAAPGAVDPGPHPAEPARARPRRAVQRHARGRRLRAWWFETCNVAYPRELLERLGGFDETFAEPLGEDTDLGWRALAAGAGREFAPAALVDHAVEDLGPAAHLRDGHGRGRQRAGVPPPPAAAGERARPRA